MRSLILLLLLTAPAAAQVTLDLKALDQPAASDAPRPKPARPAPAPRLTPAPGTAHITPPAPLPTQIPPVVRLAPGVVSPAPAPAAPTPPIAADSATKTDALPGGLRVLFASGKTDLSPDSDAALAALTADATRDADVSYDVRAYAAGTPEDPSTPRRLSLARALAVRGSLMARGVPSARIYVRALGASTTPETEDAPRDRADVTLAGPNGAPLKTADSAK